MIAENMQRLFEVSLRRGEECNSSVAIPGPSRDANIRQLQPCIEDTHEFLTVDEKEILSRVIALFDDIDPQFVMSKISGSFKTIEEITDQILNMGNGYPKLTDRLRREKVDERRDYLLDSAQFNVEQFLQRFSDPDSYFDDANRRLMNDYPDIRRDYIELRLEANRGFYVLAFHALEQENKATKKGKQIVNRQINCQIREKSAEFPVEIDEEFYMELMYVRHRREINEFRTAQHMNLEMRRNEVKASGSFVTCSICFDDECLPEDMIYCERYDLTNDQNNNHSFCKNCVRAHSIAQIGNGRAKIICLAGHCESVITLTQLRDLMPPHLYSLLLQRHSAEELRLANIQNLVHCPFCEFAVIIDDPNNRVLKCLNQKCLKESCRSCHQDNHVPQTCQEYANRDVVAMRNHIANQMAEALVRQCPRCATRMIKSDGCNMLTCGRCGQHMCYVCKQAVDENDHRGGYRHFEPPSKCKLHCALYDVHQKQVAEAATTAQEQYLHKNPQLRQAAIDQDDIDNMIDNDTDNVNQQPFNMEPYNLFNVLRPRPFDYFGAGFDRVIHFDGGLPGHVHRPHGLPHNVVPPPPHLRPMPMRHGFQVYDEIDENGRPNAANGHVHRPHDLPHNGVPPPPHLRPMPMRHRFQVYDEIDENGRPNAANADNTNQGWYDPAVAQRHRPRDQLPNLDGRRDVELVLPQAPPSPPGAPLSPLPRHYDGGYSAGAGVVEGPQQHAFGHCSSHPHQHDRLTTRYPPFMEAPTFNVASRPVMSLFPSTATVNGGQFIRHNQPRNQVPMRPLLLQKSTELNVLELPFRKQRREIIESLRKTDQFCYYGKEYANTGNNGDNDVDDDDHYSSRGEVIEVDLNDSEEYLSAEEEDVDVEDESTGLFSKFRLELVPGHTERCDELKNDDLESKLRRVSIEEPEEANAGTTRTTSAQASSRRPQSLRWRGRKSRLVAKSGKWMSHKSVRPDKSHDCNIPTTEPELPPFTGTRRMLDTTSHNFPFDIERLCDLCDHVMDPLTNNDANGDLTQIDWVCYGCHRVGIDSVVPPEMRRFNSPRCLRFKKTQLEVTQLPQSSIEESAMVSDRTLSILTSRTPPIMSKVESTKHQKRSVRVASPLLVDLTGLVDEVAASTFGQTSEKEAVIEEPISSPIKKSRLDDPTSSSSSSSSSIIDQSIQKQLDALFKLSSGSDISGVKSGDKKRDLATNALSDRLETDTKRMKINENDPTDMDMTVSTNMVVGLSASNSLNDISQQALLDDIPEPKRNLIVREKQLSQDIDACVARLAALYQERQNVRTELSSIAN